MCFWARKLNLVERGNIYSTYDLEALAECEALIKAFHVL
jgi:hypothetical protein